MSSTNVLLTMYVKRSQTASSLVSDEPASHVELAQDSLIQGPKAYQGSVRFWHAADQSWTIVRYHRRASAKCPTFTFCAHKGGRTPAVRMVLLKAKVSHATIRDSLKDASAIAPPNRSPWKTTNITINFESCMSSPVTQGVIVLIPLR